MAKKKNNMFFQKGLRMSQLRRFPSKTDIKAEGQSAKTEEQRAMILKAIGVAT